MCKILLLTCACTLAGTAAAQVTVDTTISYHLVNENSGLNLAIAGDAQTAGTGAVQEPNGALESDRWQFVPEGNGEYLIVNLYTGQVLGISGASLLEGAAALDWADNGTPDHLWIVVSAGSGQYKLQNVNSGLLLGVSGASTEAGATTLQWVDNGTPDHLWILTPAGPAYQEPLSVKVEYSATDTVGTHDPSMIPSFWGYSLFATHSSIHQHVSLDMKHFYDAGTALPTAPSWTNAYTADSGDLWAPDASYRNGRYWLYYAASSFGSDTSAIGLATSQTSLPGSWKDSGAAVYTSSACPGSNAIDPGLVLDTDGTPWMVFGSYYGGIYIVQIDAKTGQVASGASCIHLANRSNSLDAIEGSYIYYHDGYYYLFASLDACCEGVSSTYHIGVGRSTSVTGPYYDRGGLPMTEGGVTVLLSAHGRFIGPGGQSVMKDRNGSLLIYHYYDGDNSGLPSLGLNYLEWTADGWPTLLRDKSDRHDTQP
ncbi:family 43 glycosylhydrolase [Silvibacterium sp.]|uniref:family 43 glycosylhydrolase n=1 Tax=Silvibacterium sp. TaxID=1964179 RepID=UPI0039E34C85